MKLTVHRHDAERDALTPVTVELPLMRFLSQDLAPARGARSGGAPRDGLVALGRGYYAERRGDRPVWLRVISDASVEGIVLPLAEKLVLAGRDRVVLDLEGRVIRSLEPERLRAFEAARAELAPSDVPLWPVPFPPIAIVTPSVDTFGPDHPTPADGAHALLRPAFCLPSTEASFAYERLAGVPIIRSTALLRHVAERTLAGVFHPERAPVVPARADLPHVVFGVAHRAWRDLAELSR